MNLMLRFKYKPNDAVNFVVNGEKHMGTIISGGFFEDEGRSITCYCVSDLNDDSMLYIDEESLDKSTTEEIEGRLAKTFEAMFAGTGFQIN